MTTTTTQKAVSAPNVTGLHTDTNAADFATAGAAQQAHDGETATLQHCMNPGKQPDKPDVPDSGISNDQFLSAIFGNDFKLERPLVCFKSGDPGAVDGWPAKAWPCDTSDSSLNWYGLPSLFAPNDAGRYRALKNLAGDVYCAMLDDVGTRVPLDRIAACPATWMIETSPGNYQAGYVFDAPIDKEQADALKAALIEAQLCDKGASGGSARWMRLPVAINGKPKYGTPSFQCKLTEWHPERRYTVDDIIDRLELAPPQQTIKPGKKAAAIDRNADNIYTPRADENAVIAALKQRGLYKQPLGSGKHDVTCFRVYEHTDQTDHGSCYFEPSDLYPVGGYKCQHGHGDNLKIGALLEFLNVTFIAARHKPQIKVEAGELHRIVDAAERELAASKRYYQRGGLIASIITDPESHATEIKPVSQPGLLRALSSAAIWTRFDGRSQADVVCDPPARHITVLFDSEGYQHLPVLTGIARQPHLRPDGSLVRDAGFDATTGLFGVFDARQFNVPDRPTRQQAEHALSELEDLLGEFEFAKPHDQAAALAGLLTATIRPSLALAPMLHVRAPQIASGKSYLTSIIVAFASPTTPSAVAFPTNEEECAKLLLATLLNAPGAIVFDNLTTDLIPYKSLCSALTEEHLTGRILGFSKTATVGTRALFLSSGNNVDAVRDMSRRCITVNLDPQCETPATRQFSADPLVHVRANRARFVSLALTVIRAWIYAGKPTTHCKPLASYTQWSDWVRQPLLWLGLADPATSVFEQLAQDPDRETLGRLLQGWRKAFGTDPAPIRDIIKKSQSFEYDPELGELLKEIAELRGEVNHTRLGKWVTRHQSRIVDGLRFEKAGGTTSVVRWQVKVQSGTSGKAGTFPEVVQSVIEDDFVTEDL
jgi:hypothetical protein